MVDRNGRIQDYNLAQKETSDREPAPGDVMFRDYAGKYPMNMHAELIDCIARQTTKKFDAVPYGDKHFSVTMAPLPDGAIVAALDVTKMKKAEQEVRKLSRQVVQSEENERRKISWLLHDELIQELACLKMTVDALLMDKGRPSAEVWEAVKGLPKMVGHAIKTTRSMSQKLHPTLLDRFGLITAVRELCKEFGEKNHCRVDFETEGVNTGELDPSLAITLYRIIVEAFGNIRKHAHADLVVLRLSATPQWLHLLIQDDGTGFDRNRQSAEASKGKHLGMSIMRERAALLRGEMEIETEPGGGTRLRFRFPFKEADK